MKQSKIFKNMLILISILIPLRINALSLDCPSVASVGEEITCKITEDNIMGFKANFDISSEIDYLSIDTNTPWKNYYSSNLGIVLGAIEVNNLTSNINLRISSRAVLNQEYIVGLTNIEEVDLDLNNTYKENTSSKIKIVSNITTLSSISIDNEILSKDFSPNITTYQVTTKKDTVELSATPTDISATIEGLGIKSLSIGVNKFIIKVTSERGTSKEYIIYITRLPETINKEEKSAENNTIKQEYQDTSLKSLTINNKNISLKKNKYFYELTLDNKEENLDIKAIPNLNGATIKIEKPDKLKVGDNEVKIIVEFKDSTSTYLIKVTRKRKLDNDASIKSISIENYNLDFSSNKCNYTLKINSEDKLKFIIKLNSKYATYKIIGNKNLENNSIIKIKVTAEDKSIKTYTIKIKKEDADKSISIVNNLKIVPIIIFIVLVLILIGKVQKQRKVNKFKKNL